MELDPAVADVYAHALLNAAARTGVTDRLVEDADAVRRSFRKDARIRPFLESPRILKAEKQAVIDRIFRGRVEPLLLNFVHVMLENNRIENLGETLRLLFVLVEEGRGIIPASVTTAVALTPEQRSQLQQTLESRLGLRFDVRFRVDAQVFGGVVFKYRDRLIDGSARFDVQKLRERLMAVTVA